MNPLERSSANKHEFGWENTKFRHEESTYSFNSHANKFCPPPQAIQKSSTSPLRWKYFTPCDESNGYERNVANSDWESRSRSRSGFRKMSHSPINVNTSYEISHKNTENLWKEFCSNVNERSSSQKHNALRVRDAYRSNFDIQRQPLANLQPRLNDRLDEDYGRQQPSDLRFTNENLKYSYIDSKHMHKISANSNYDTNHFVETSKSEEMNKVMNEHNLRKLIQVTGEDPAKEQVALRSNFSFDRNSQVLWAFGQNNSTQNKASHASQFTFNSTDRNRTNELDSFKNKQSKIWDFVKDSIINEIKQENKSRIKIFTGPNTFEGSREVELDQKEFPIMNTVRQILQKDEAKSSHEEGSSNFQNSYVTESKESTTAIRERLKNKINSLREKISSSQNNTIRSVQENLRVPINRLNQNYNTNKQPIETVRVHSRDGSKSIEGSGLEIDEFVNSWDDRIHGKNVYLDKYANFSSKHDTFNTVSYQGESVRSANTFQSKKKYENEFKNKSNFQEYNPENQSFSNTKTLEHYFTIEDLKNSREGEDSSNPKVPKRKFIESKDRKRNKLKEIVNITSLNTTTQLQKSRKPYKYQSSGTSNKVQSSQKQKPNLNYSGNSSFNNKILSKKSKSSNKKSIRSLRSKITYSQKRSGKNEKLMNYPINKTDKSYTHTSPKDPSSSDAEETNNYGSTPNRVEESRSYKKPLYSMLSHIRKRPSVSPKRPKSYYNK